MFLTNNSKKNCPVVTYSRQLVEKVVSRYKKSPVGRKSRQSVQKVGQSVQKVGQSVQKVGQSVQKVASRYKKSSVGIKSRQSV